MCRYNLNAATKKTHQQAAVWICMHTSQTISPIRDQKSDRKIKTCAGPLWFPRSFDKQILNEKKKK